MKKLLLVLMIMMLIVLSACGSDSTDKSDGSDSGSESASAAEAVTDAGDKDSTEIGEKDPDDSVFEIEAGGLKLKYPKKWKDKVTVKVTDDAVYFTYNKKKLFDILFNSSKGTVLGTVKGDDYTVVSAVTYSLDKKADSDMQDMQMDMNTILYYLNKDYDFAADQALEKDSSETFDIETSTVTLKYPSKWKDKVTVKVDGDTVKFSDGDTPIFDIVFKKSNEGYQLGTYKDTPVYVIDYPVKSDDDIAMQADINVIIEHLKEDKNFVVA